MNMATSMSVPTLGLPNRPSRYPSTITKTVGAMTLMICSIPTSVHAHTVARQGAGGGISSD